MNRAPLAIGAALAVMSVPAHGYLRANFNFTDGSSVPIKRSDAHQIQFYVNSGLVSGATSALSGKTVIAAGVNVGASVQAALATWNAIGTSAARFLPLLTTDSKIASSDKQATIALAGSNDDLSVLGGLNGAYAVTIMTSASFIAGSTPGDVVDSDIMINPGYTFSTDGSTPADLQAVLTHELGHALGLNHSGLQGATMFQYASYAQRYLTSDETAFAASIYPLAGSAPLGVLTGKIVNGDGSPVQSGLVEFIDPQGGASVSALTAIDGTYTTSAPAGSYVVYAEPVGGSGLIQRGNLYIPLNIPITSNFRPTVLGGIGNPTMVSVSAANTTTVPTLSVTPGPSSLTPPFAGMGKAGGSHDISTVQQGAFILPSNQSVDIALIGGGVDGTVGITPIGQGVSVRAGSLHVDTSVVFGDPLSGQPLVRATLDIAPHASPALATLLITKGTDVLAMSGVLVLAPPAPVISNVQDAESARTTIVPGEWVAIYGTNLAGGTRVWGSSDFVNGNVLPPALGGVGVSFNGIPAAVYVVSAGQINAQAPSGLNGDVNVVVSNNGSVSAAFKTTAVAAAPSLFYYPAANKLYPAAVHLNGSIIGDPAALPGTTKVSPGETIVLFANGLSSSPAGTIISSVVPYTDPVFVSVGGMTVTPTFAGLVAAGEYQLNVTIPKNLASGDYSLAVSSGGQTSSANITLPVGP